MLRCAEHYSAKVSQLGENVFGSLIERVGEKRAEAGGGRDSSGAEYCRVGGKVLAFFAGGVK